MLLDALDPPDPQQHTDAVEIPTCAVAAAAAAAAGCPTPLFPPNETDALGVNPPPVPLLLLLLLLLLTCAVAAAAAAAAGCLGQQLIQDLLPPAQGGRKGRLLTAHVIQDALRIGCHLEGERGGREAMEDMQQHKGEHNKSIAGCAAH
jgi:hypothetical protein